MFTILKWLKQSRERRRFCRQESDQVIDQNIEAIRLELAQEAELARKNGIIPLTPIQVSVLDLISSLPTSQFTAEFVERARPYQRQAIKNALNRLVSEKILSFDDTSQQYHRLMSPTQEQSIVLAEKLRHKQLLQQYGLDQPCACEAPSLAIHQVFTGI